MTRPTRLLTLALCLLATMFVYAQRKSAKNESASTETPSGYSYIIDLTQKESERSPNWEGTEKSPFEATVLGHIEKDGYFSRMIKMPEHFSTHIDAPAHFARGVWTVDQIPPDRLVGPLVVIDVTEQSTANHDYLLSMDDIARWEKAYERIPPGAIVMARTGWSKKFYNMGDYRGAGADGVMHFPGFALDAVKFLVESRAIAGLGIDTMGVDPGPSKDFPVHRYTAPRNIYHLENVGDLSKAPDVGALAVVAPIKLEGGSGGPVRIFALVK